MVAYTEAPNRRRKDRDDLKSPLRGYEAGSDRIFGADIFAAQPEDIEYANAFPLGSDVGAIVTDEDAEIVSGFLGRQRMSAVEQQELDRDDPQHRETLRFQLQLQTFENGFGTASQK